MSAFQMNPDRIATIADAITKQYNSGHGLTGMSLGRKNESVESIYNACRKYADCPDHYKRSVIWKEHLYRALWDMNREAVNARYPDMQDHGEAPLMPGKHERVICQLVYDDEHWHVPDRYYQLLKWCECFLYQCAEGDVPDSPLYQAVEDYCVQLRSFIIHNHPAYAKAKWG